MALFKILKGKKTNLPSGKVEGYAYVTTDEHKFYVDISATERICLNADTADRLAIGDGAANQAITGGTNGIKWTNIAPAAEWTNYAATGPSIKISVLGATSTEAIIPLATVDHSGAISVGQQEIRGNKIFSQKDTIKFSTGAKPYLINKELTWDATGGRYWVILLLPELTATNQNVNNFLDGRFMFYKTNADRYNIVDVTVSCCYNKLCYYLQSHGEDGTFELCKVVYNNIKYIALKVPNNNYTRAAFTGRVYSTLDGGNEGANFPLDIPYSLYYKTGDTVNNTEVNDSLTTELVSNYITSVQRYKLHLWADGANITNLNASYLATGTVPLERLPSIPASLITTGILSVPRGGTGVGSWTKNQVVLTNATNGAEPFTSRAYNDSSSANALGTSTNFVTERDIYYGLPTINNAHNYSSSTTIYAPTTGGTADTHALVGAGATTAPQWVAISPGISVTGGTTAGPTLKITVLNRNSNDLVIPSAGTTASGIVTTAAQSFAGVKTFTDLIKITKNDNTVTIGSNNASYCHFSNSADIPFYFNKSIWVDGDLYPYGTTNTRSLGSTSKRWKTLYIGTADSYGSAYKPIYWNAGVPAAVSDNGLIVNLASTAGDSVFAQSPRPGVTGTLAIAHGGTGATTAAAALVALLGSTAIGSTTQPIYWNGSAFAKANAYSTLFTDFGSSGNTLTITIGGTQKTASIINSLSLESTAGNGSNAQILTLKINGQTGNSLSLTKGTTSAYGVVKLTSTYSSSDTTLAVTGAAVLAAIQTLDVTAIGGGTGEYITSIGETDGKISATKATTTVVNTWTGGTTAGPSLKTTVNGINSNDAIIPSASTSASGIVTTGAQSFAGAKTFGNITISGTTDTAKKTIVSSSTLYLDTDASSSLIIQKGGTNKWRYDAAGTAIHPETTNQISLGVSGKRWSKLFVGTADSYGSAYKPIYWNAGIPAAVSDNAVIVNLASTSGDSIFAQDPRPGVTGILAIANGGTGGASAAAARSNLSDGNYLTCSTAAATAAKTIALTGFALKTGVIVNVIFTVQNTAASPTLNINSTGAKSIYCKGVQVKSYGLKANVIYRLLYDGTQWQVMNDIIPAMGSCTTAVGTAAKTVNIAGFVPYVGAVVYIQFTKNNSALTPTLNINGYGANPIRNRNVKTGTFYYPFRPDQVYGFVYTGSEFVVINHVIQENVTLGVTAHEAVTDPDTGEVITPAVAEVHGTDSFVLGNPTTSTTDGGLTGRLGLYNAGTKVAYITAIANTASSDRNWYLPNLNSDRYFITHSAATALGSNTQPIKIDANGAVSTCSTYAGGTAVTLNNTSKAASTASFYAPTAGGTTNYVLLGAGTTAAPIWKAPKDTANILLNALDTGSTTPVDADYYISQYVGGGTTTTTYHRRPMSALWAYIKGKGDATYKAIQTAVSDPTASGTALTFIATISQNTQGVITVTKKTVQDASTSQSGVVNTGAQSFKGAKTFTGGLVIKNSAASPQIEFRSNDSTGALAGLLFMNEAQTNSIYRADRWYFREYSYNSTSGATLSYYEQYRLPVPNEDRTGNASYEILTTKAVVSVAQGGTGKASWTPWGIVYASAATTLAQVAAGTDTNYGNKYQFLMSDGAAAPVWRTALNLSTGNLMPVLDNATDFNTITTPSVYCVRDSAAMKTMVNNPFGDQAASGGRLITMGGYTTTANSYQWQFLLMSSGAPHFRNRANTTWNAWKTFVTIPANTAKGSGIIPVYVDVTGAVTPSTSTVGSGTQPIWLSGGTLKNTTYALNATISAGVASHVAYYSAVNTISQVDQWWVNSTSIHFRSDAFTRTETPSANKEGAIWIRGNAAAGTYNSDYIAAFSWYRWTSNNTGIRMRIWGQDGNEGSFWYIRTAANVGYITWTGAQVGNSIIPTANNSYDLGNSSTLRWRSAYFTTSIWIGSTDYTATNAAAAGTYLGVGYMEMSASTPYIDLHRSNNTGDYTGRIIADATARLHLVYGGTTENLTYNSRSRGVNLYNQGILYSSGSIETADYFLTNVASAAGGYYTYLNNTQQGRWYVGVAGTTDAVGENRLNLGNGTASGAANNARGVIYLYGSGAYYTRIWAQAPSNRDFYLPNYAGAMYAVHAGSNDAVGNVYTPVYVAANGRVTIAKALPAYEARGTTTDLNKAANYVGAGAMFHLIASSSTTTGKCSFDANVLQMNWDNNGGYDSQLAISTSGSRMQFRSQVSAGTAWREVATIAAATQTGSGTQPVYISSTGVVTVCTAYTGLLTAFSLSTNTLSITVGGTTKTASAVSAVSNTWTGGTTAGPTIKTTVNGVAGSAVAIPSASASASGIVTTGTQTFAGAKTFNATIKITANDNTVTIGSQNTSWCHFTNSADIPFYFNKKIHAVGGFQIYNQANAQLITDRCTVYAANGVVGIHSSTNRGVYEFTDSKWIIYLQHSDDTVHSGYKIYNAVWNDFAEMREGDITEGGYAVYDDGHGHMRLCTERLQPGARLTSDTFGIVVGHTETAKTPIGVAGRVLAYPAQDRMNYKVGDAVCAAPGGKVDIMTREEIMMYPERILGTVSEIPDYEIWNQRYKAEEEKEYTETNIPVKGRIWIYVR